jgi:hypothetical protein
VWVFASNSEVCGIKVFNRLRGIIHITKKRRRQRRRRKLTVRVLKVGGGLFGGILFQPILKLEFTQLKAPPNFFTNKKKIKIKFGIKIPIGL